VEISLEAGQQGGLVRYERVVELLELRAAKAEGPSGTGVEIGALALDELWQIHIEFGEL
jgi:hypothetical protein